MEVKRMGSYGSKDNGRERGGGEDIDGRVLV